MSSVKEPDVSVIVPVYNTMPYLTSCLDSLVDQTIGHDRLEVIAVDDGSTDGSGAELDRYAARYPGVVAALHQPNSGGPASPCNHGLDRAAGRYVFFVGADDHLGLEAMERLVDAADRWGSDIAFGRMVGTNGRWVWQKIFERTEPDLELYGSLLPFAISNTKLFRRDLIERHALRFPRDVSMGSDQPFTVEAMIRAKRISVLGDYTYYYAVRRENASNISYSSSWRERLRCTGRIMDKIAGLLEPGPRRDAVLRRHFRWELSKLLESPTLELAQDDQRELCEGIRRLCDEYLAEGIRKRLHVYSRLRLELARHGKVDALDKVIRYEADHDNPPLAVRGSHVVAAYPDLSAVDIPDSVRSIHESSIVPRLSRDVVLRSARWEAGELVVTAQLGLVQGTTDLNVRVETIPIPAASSAPPARRVRDLDIPPTTEQSRTVDQTPEERCVVLSARLAVDDDREGGDARPVAWSVRIRLDIHGYTYDLPILTTRTKSKARIRIRGRRFVVTARGNASGRLVIIRKPLAVPVSADSDLTRGRVPGHPR